MLLRLRLASACATRLSRVQQVCSEVRSEWLRKGRRVEDARSLAHTLQNTDDDVLQVSAAIEDLRRERKEVPKIRRRLQFIQKQFEVQKEAQKGRERTLLSAHARPCLEAASRLLPGDSLSLPSSDDDLSIRESSLADAISDQGFDEATEADGDLRVDWRRARKAVKEAHTYYEQVLDFYSKKLAGHLYQYSKSTRAEFDEIYRDAKGYYFKDIEAYAKQQIEEAEGECEAMKVRARTAGIEDVPLSPIWAADSSRDGYNDSCNSTRRL